MNKSLNLKFERAVRLLSDYLPVSDEFSRKPVLFHDIRVGVYLYENGYSEEIVLAGVLHDALEFSEINEQTLYDEFGEVVFNLVSACTKDDAIIDSEEKINELIKRCVDAGQDALIVKAADIIDSFKYYSKEQNIDQLQNHCLKNAETIFRFKPSEYNDKIFEELKMWQNKVSS